ncbi:MAG: 6-bladed beta-propeller [Candidatus Aminicenantes bacterium]|nr:6-bladed beta-propeller [Candidatus Aminicenantes bacterium]NIM79350.1 6-bladed beta-propeller [Candidatus Aminicenantes bacterium]NIN18627.1 6-bladed beta-propeller [Candidatus Aminicenantes bacterium]NIN42516.1 6-bladed beta-propeller [Candidatus Aminicenantes bacterium]NIN85282.1 6-bladed beta-propeller [Candidatus Aminicenantes bacterium]
MRSKPGGRGLIWIFTAALVFCFAPLLPAQSVRFVRTLDLSGKTGKKNIKTFLLGKKEKKGCKPFSICRLGENRLCVTDTVNGAVIVLDNNGRIKKTVTHVKGFKIVSPVSACGDDRGNLYVSDSARQEVWKFDSGYQFEAVFIPPLPGEPGGRITGIVFVGGDFYGVDTPNHRVLCFDRGGKLKYSVGKRGTAGGEFNFPTHIAADSEFIYVTDALNFRVQIFDRSGRFIRSLGSFGRGGGDFSKPKGIAVDRERRIFVTDVMFDNVQIFDFKGRFLYYFGGPGHRDGEFWMPAGIMVDRDNTIWVADTYNNRIQVFQLVEKTS